ncbi:MAG: exopolysaccharide biosynthesis protein [Opitutaceae bacterium]
MRPTANDSPSPASPRLSTELHQLAETFRERTVTLRELIATLGERATALLVVILALPFCAPVSIPGLSVPFGAVILLLSAGYATGRPLWLPARLLAVELPPRFFRGLLEATSRLLGWIERRMRPRWLWFTAGRGWLRLHALAVCAGALLLLLPLGGIPFTNTLPALVVVVGTLGMLERDGAAVAAAYGLLVATLAYFALFAGVAFEVTQRLLRAWSG